MIICEGKWRVSLVLARNGKAILYSHH